MQTCNFLKINLLCSSFFLFGTNLNSQINKKLSIPEATNRKPDRLIGVEHTDIAIVVV